MLRSKISVWWKYTKSTFKTKNAFLPMALKLDDIAISCLREIENTKSCKEILANPDLAQFFFAPYATSLNYHQAIVSASMSQYGLSSFSLVRPQLEAGLIFLYFCDSKNDHELFHRIESYQDWVVLKMYENANKSNEFEFMSHLSQHESYMHQIQNNYETLMNKYSTRSDELKKLKRPSFLHNKRAIAKAHDIEGLYLHVQAEASASIHISDVSDRVSYEIISNQITYDLNTNSDESYWILMLSNLLQLNTVKSMAKTFDIYPAVRDQLKQCI